MIISRIRTGRPRDEFAPNANRPVRKVSPEAGPFLILSYCYFDFDTFAQAGYRPVRTHAPRAR